MASPLFRVALVSLLFGPAAIAAHGQDSPATRIAWSRRPDSIALANGVQNVSVLLRDSLDRAPVKTDVLLYVATTRAALEAAAMSPVDSQTTDGAGEAKLRLRLGGSTPDRLWVAARTRAGLTTDALDILIVEAEPDRIVIVTGIPTTESGMLVHPAPSFKVTGNGRAIKGLDVTLEVQRGIVHLTGNLAITDTAGVATFGELRLTTPCDTNNCQPVHLAVRARKAKRDLGETQVLRPSTLKVVIHGDTQRVATVGRALIPGVRVQVLGGNNSPVRGAIVLALEDRLTQLQDARTDANGFATFNGLKLSDRAGERKIALVSGSAGAILHVTLNAGEPVALSILKQPPPRVAYDSAWTPSPAIQVIDGAGNPVPSADVRAILCMRPLQAFKAEDTSRDSTLNDPNGKPRSKDSRKKSKSKRTRGPWKCLEGGVEDDTSASVQDHLAGLEGRAVVRTDGNGVATFDSLRLHARAGEYRLRFCMRNSACDGSSMHSSSIVYDPVRDFDRNFVVISAIKTISGIAPDDEFFDLRFRFRLRWHLYVQANIDVSLSARGTDSVRSSQKRLSEASLMLHGRLAFTQDRATDVPQRQMYTGAQLKVFNTVPYYGLHLGGTELGGSAFQGSMLSFGYLHRWFSDPLVVVNNDTAEVARHNANVDFFIRSSIVEFFKVITIRGSVLLPMHGRGRIASRIAIAVPVGGVYTF